MINYIVIDTDQQVLEFDTLQEIIEWCFTNAIDTNLPVATGNFLIYTKEYYDEFIANN